VEKIMAFGAIVAVVRPVLLKIATHPAVKNLFIELLQKYVDSTETSIDDAILDTIVELIDKPQE
tara:strand:+ start:210 stop:401 length:192 start_codon:yes stop_codon:yes gene_type:complete